MNRALFIRIHMYLAAFFAPFVLLVSISGGLYLIGVKGSVTEQALFQFADFTIDTGSDRLKADIDALLQAAGVNGTRRSLEPFPRAVK